MLKKKRKKEKTENDIILVNFVNQTPLIIKSLNKILGWTNIKDFSNTFNPYEMSEKLTLRKHEESLRNELINLEIDV
jgi:hypothetical protein